VGSSLQRFTVIDGVTEGIERPSHPGDVGSERQLAGHRRHPAAEFDSMIRDERRNVDRLGLDACDFGQNRPANARDRNGVADLNELRTARNDDIARTDPRDFS
jgi:hypothetical protein